MLNPRELIRQDILTAVVYLGFVLAIGTFSIREAASHYLSESSITSRSIELAKSAIAIQPRNADAYTALGEALAGIHDYAAAAEAFDQAVSLRKNDFRLWISLGDARYHSNDLSGAEAAYDRAMALAPNYAQPRYRFGLMLLETGRTEEAFVHLSTAGERDHELYTEILRLARSVYQEDAASIQKALHPRSTATENYFAHYAVMNSLMTPQVEEFLASSERTDRERNWYARRLIAMKNFRAAYKIWSGGQETGTIVHDGGFESTTESSPGGFGWQIDQKVSNTSLARIDSDMRSGGYAIHIHFSGDLEPNRSIISQIVVLKPQHKYRLRFSLRSEKLLSARLPVVTITDATSGALLGRVNITEETDGQWVDKTFDFVTRSNAAVSIGIQRENCPAKPCPLFGDLYFDDFAIEEY